MSDNAPRNKKKNYFARLKKIRFLRAIFCCSVESERARARLKHTAKTKKFFMNSLNLLIQDYRDSLSISDGTRLVLIKRWDEQRICEWFICNTVVDTWASRMDLFRESEMSIWGSYCCHYLVDISRCMTCRLSKWHSLWSHFNM